MQSSIINPTPVITTLPETKLIGVNLTMSFANNRTPELWRSFMPRRREIDNAVGTNLYSVQRYPEGFFSSFDPTASFKKWAAVAVTGFDTVPMGMQALVLPKGLYAVFQHRGGPARAVESFGYVFREWLPASGYTLDLRPHFELLGDKYGDGGPESEEEIWIPVKAL